MCELVNVLVTSQRTATAAPPPSMRPRAPAHARHPHADSAGEARLKWQVRFMATRARGCRCGARDGGGRAAGKREHERHDTAATQNDYNTRDATSEEVQAAHGRGDASQTEQDLEAERKLGILQHLQHTAEDLGVKVVRLGGVHQIDELRQRATAHARAGHPHTTGDRHTDTDTHNKTQTHRHTQQETGTQTHRDTEL